MLQEYLVVGVDEDGAAHAGEVAIQLRLGVDYPLKAAEALQVCTPHVGDEAVVRTGYLAQRGNLAGVVGAHLHDGNLRVGGDGEEGEGHAEVVVVVALRGVGAVLARQHGVHQLLRRDLAVRPCDADNGDGESAAMIFRQLLQRLQNVRHHNAPFVRLILRVADYAQGSTLFQRLGCKSVAVEFFALEGKKDTSRRDGSGISRDRARLQVCLIYLFNHVSNNADKIALLCPNRDKLSVFCHFLTFGIIFDGIIFRIP